MENEAVSKNFIEQEIDKDLAEGVYDHVCTRFPCFPKGLLRQQVWLILWRIGYKLWNLSV